MYLTTQRFSVAWSTSTALFHHFLEPSQADWRATYRPTPHRISSCSKWLPLTRSSCCLARSNSSDHASGLRYAKSATEPPNLLNAAPGIKRTDRWSPLCPCLGDKFSKEGFREHAGRSNGGVPGLVGRIRLPTEWLLVAYAGVRASVASRPCGCSCHEVHFIKREESRNGFDDLQTALRALNPRDASFSRRGSLPTIR